MTEINYDDLNSKHQWDFTAITKEDIEIVEGVNGLMVIGAYAPQLAYILWNTFYTCCTNNTIMPVVGFSQLGFEEQKKLFHSAFFNFYYNYLLRNADDDRVGEVFDAIVYTLENHRKDHLIEEIFGIDVYGGEQQVSEIEEDIEPVEIPDVFKSAIDSLDFGGLDDDEASNLYSI